MGMDGADKARLEAPDAPMGDDRHGDQARRVRGDLTHQHVEHRSLRCLLLATVRARLWCFLRLTSYDDI